MLELLKKVLKPVAPSGLEEPVAAVIREEVAPYVDSIETDALGNLICVKNGTEANPEKIMLSAHMDHIGYIVTGIEKEGFLRVTNVGGISPTMSLTRHVSFPNGVQGVVVSEVSKDTAMKDLFVDIGAQDKADAETMVQIGDVCVYANDCFQLGANRVASPAMDDRAACALLIRFLQTVGATKQTIIAVFSVQEEVGCRGAKVASFAKAPDKGIAIDVTAWGDTPGTEAAGHQARRGHCREGDGSREHLESGFAGSAAGGGCAGGCENPARGAAVRRDGCVRDADQPRRNSGVHAVDSVPVCAFGVRSG